MRSELTGPSQPEIGYFCLGLHNITMSVLVYSVFTQVCVAWVALQLYLPLWKPGDCTKGFLDWLVDLYLFLNLILYLQVEGKNCSASVDLSSIQ